MTLLESICDELMTDLNHKLFYVAKPEREAIRSTILKKFAPFVPEPQQQLGFDDAKVNADQAAAILKLLKERRSAGATNGELSKLALKYTSRLSDLRKQGYIIHCDREHGRTFRYRLHATDW